MRLSCISLLLVFFALPALQPARAQGLLGGLKEKARQKLQHALDSTPASGASTSSPAAATTAMTPTGQPSSTSAPTAASPSTTVFYKDPNQALSHATYVGDAEGCAAAIARGADASKIPLALTLQQASTNLPLIQCLVEHGANPDKTMETNPELLGDTPLVLSVEHNRYDIAEYLIAHGAKVTEHSSNRSLMDSAHDGSEDGYCHCTTALGIAAASGNPQIVDLLIAHDADTHMKFADRHAPPGRSVLDIAQLYLTEAASDYTGAPSATTRARLDADCAVYATLKDHGAQATAASYGHNGSPACNISPEERARLQSEFSKQDVAHADNERKRTLLACSQNYASSFYDCSCFSSAIAAYRSTHSASEPMESVVSHADYSACIGSSARMVQFGTSHALLEVPAWHLTAQQNNSIAACTGNALPAAFRAHPGIQTSVISSDFQGVFKSCREQYAK